MEITSLKNRSFDDIADVFMDAFTDYDIDISKRQLYAMLVRRGFNPELSFGAVENERVIAFIFNGIGAFNNIRTAYDTGTGTISEYRGKGIASRIFAQIIDPLRDAGINQYLLEVLQHNTPALRIYRSHGFEVTREFNCYTASAINEKCAGHTIPDKTYIEEICIDDILKISGFDDFVPSWQNDNNSIRRAAIDFRGVAAKVNGEICGYGIIDPASGDITRIAVAPEWRRQGIGSAILTHLFRLNYFGSLKVLNVQSDCSSMDAFMMATGFGLKCQQFEMIKQL